MADMLFQENDVPQGSSELVRNVAQGKYVHPAIAAGKTRFSISVRDLMHDLEGTGFPARNYPQVCTALRTNKFLRENGLEIESVDGPPSGLSTTVVVHYRTSGVANPTAGEELANESPAGKAKRLTARLRGLYREEIASFGGAEAYMHWLRSEDEEERASLEREADRTLAESKR